ncbi:MAG: hypothetical protein Ct9H300mP8_01290 [Gammaproteobacteria bacterium]|nr:MAG: hypothetical protein Ct9H300mP8_01290 [Gammaproteobacteria bacterium]
MGRVDDVMNVAGHRLSTGQMEEVVADHPAVAECAVVGIRDRDKGQVPLGLVLLKGRSQYRTIDVRARIGSDGTTACGGLCQFSKGLRGPAASENAFRKDLKAGSSAND